MKVFMIAAACLAAAVSADPWLGYGYGLHQQSWPGVRAPGFEGTCYGCRPVGHYLGKRSAEPYYGYAGFYGHPGFYGYGRGIAAHGLGATSFVARSPQGLGK